jgi:hypothetical protein
MSSLASDGTNGGRLEDLEWSSLCKQERLVVASIIERAEGFELEHLGMVAEDLRDQVCSGLGAPLLLTARQSRAVARAIEREAVRLEDAAERWRDSPAIELTARHASGFLRTLLDRLLKRPAAASAVGLPRIVQLLLVEPPDAAGSQQQLAEAMNFRSAIIVKSS